MSLKRRLKALENMQKVGQKETAIVYNLEYIDYDYQYPSNKILDLKVTKVNNGLEEKELIGLGEYITDIKEEEKRGNLTMFNIDTYLKSIGFIGDTKEDMEDFLNKNKKAREVLKILFRNREKLMIKI